MKFFIRLVIALFVLGSILGYVAYDKIFGVNTSDEEKELFIPTGSEYNYLTQLLESEGIVRDVSSFGLVSKLMKYGSKVRPGRFIIPAQLSNRKLIQLLRSGKQSPVNVTISTGRKLENIAGVVSKRIEADSQSILSAFLNPAFLESMDLDTANAISAVIPNTYEFFWDTDAVQFAERMKKESDLFWNEERDAKRRSMDMSRSEVSTLAAIVEKESNLKAERPTMAGVYVNRLNQDIPLQADPTVVFGLNDFTIRRVLNKHLESDTPYNTYKYSGLPLGPICMPSISSIDAILNYERHDYIFFCAKPGYNNGHLFAETNAQHERNARKYHRWLDQEGIKG